MLKRSSAGLIRCFKINLSRDHIEPGQVWIRETCYGQHVVFLFYSRDEPSREGGDLFIFNGSSSISPISCWCTTVQTRIAFWVGLPQGVFLQLTFRRHSSAKIEETRLFVLCAPSPDIIGRWVLAVWLHVQSLLVYTRQAIQSIRQVNDCSPTWLPWTIY